MRVLILTQHYAPEITAARFRIEVFADRLVRAGHHVDVVCPVPNHPTGNVPREYRGRLRVSREVGGAEVRYVWVRTTPERTPGGRLAFYASYAALGSIIATTVPQPDIVLATSPPLSVGAVGAVVGKLRRRPWVLDVRDLWPSAAELMGEVTSQRVIRAAEWLEKRLYRSAAMVTVASRPFVDHVVAAGAAEEKVELVPNGTTEQWLTLGATEVDRGELDLARERFIWTYAGNLGPSRRLDVALDAAEALGDDFELVLIGDGGARDALAERIGQMKSGHAALLGLMPPDRAARYLRASDALFVPQQELLGDFVPSKLYDCSAIGRPLVVAAAGETMRLANEAGVGVGVRPADTEALVAAVRRLRDEPVLADEMSARGREFAREHLRERQGDHLVGLLERTVERRARKR
jgi:putative colanic acid biosynthesis glycosyltransferase WcaI